MVPHACVRKDRVLPALQNVSFEDKGATHAQFIGNPNSYLRKKGVRRERTRNYQRYLVCNSEKYVEQLIGMAKTRVESINTNTYAAWTFGYIAESQDQVIETEQPLALMLYEPQEIPQSLFAPSMQITKPGRNTNGTDQTVKITQASTSRTSMYSGSRQEGNERITGAKSNNNKMFNRWFKQSCSQ